MPVVLPGGEAGYRGKEDEEALLRAKVHHFILLMAGWGVSRRSGGVD